MNSFRVRQEKLQVVIYHPDAAIINAARPKYRTSLDACRRPRMRECTSERLAGMVLLPESASRYNVAYA
jgi:hypothetical protein